MRYPIESYLPPTRSSVQNSPREVIALNDHLKKFAAHSNWQYGAKDVLGYTTYHLKDENTYEWLLSDFEHLLLGINILSWSIWLNKTPEYILFFTENKSIIRNDFHTSLTLASAQMPIAHYYLAKGFSFFDGETSKQLIEYHYSKALDARHALPDFVTQFDHYLPQCKQLAATVPKSHAAVLKEILEYQFSEYTDTQLLEKAKEKDTPIQKKGDQFFELATRYNEKGNKDAALPYLLIAALCCDHKEAWKCIQDRSKELPDLISYCDKVKSVVAAFEAFETKLQFIECYLAVYYIYRYLHQNKIEDGTASKLFKSMFTSNVEDQNLRQECFILLIPRLAQKKFKDAGALLEWINGVSEAAEFNKGVVSQQFYNLLMELVKITSLPTGSHFGIGIFDLLARASECLFDCLKSQMHLPDSFARKIFLTAQKPKAQASGERKTEISLQIEAPTKSRLEFKPSGEPCENLASSAICNDKL